MDQMTLLTALLYLLSSLLIWQFVGYPLLMGLIALRAKHAEKDYTHQPFVSIVVPAYNEEKSIKKRLENLLELDYPKNKYEIIVVESGSSDNTGNFAREFIENFNSSESCIKLLEESERNGKASAINFGKEHAKGEIVLVTDANSLFHKNVLREIMPHFKDPKVGAVGGQYVVLNPDKPLTSSTQFYWDLEYIMRRGEASLDSACLFHGEINAWRKDLVSADVRMLSEDLDMAIQIRKNGHKIEYESRAIVYENAAATSRDQITQRKRTSVGTIQNIFKHWNYLLLPRDWYSFLIFHSHKTLAMLSPFLILSILIGYLIVLDASVIVPHIIATFIVFLLLFWLLMVLKQKLADPENPKSSAKFSLLSLPKIMYYVILNEYLILLAWKDFILRRYSILWEKAETTRF